MNFGFDVKQPKNGAKEIVVAEFLAGLVVETGCIDTKFVLKASGSKTTIRI